MESLHENIPCVRAYRVRGLAGDYVAQRVNASDHDDGIPGGGDSLRRSLDHHVAGTASAEQEGSTEGQIRYCCQSVD